MTDLRSLLSTRPCVLLDFDGPICSVFAGLPNHAAADELVAVLNSAVPADVADSDDPFDVLRYSASLSAELAAKVEQRFTEIEIEAMASARPTPDADVVIRTAAERGTVAIVSNNSPAAISTYLARHNLRQYVTGIFGRTSADIAQLKPSPYLLLAATTELETPTAQCAFVGDSVSDIEAATAATISAIAFANRPEKYARFVAHSPSAIITSMSELLAALTT